MALAQHGLVAAASDGGRPVDEVGPGRGVLEGLLRHTASAAAVRDAQGAHLWVNAAFLDIVDVPRRSVLGERWSAFQPEPIAVAHALNDQHVLTSGEPRGWRTPVHRGAGPGEMAGVTFPVELAAGVRGVGSTFVDLAGLQRERVAVAERRYQNLFDGSRSPILIVGLDGIVRDANPAYCHLLRYRPDEVRGTSVTQLVTRATVVAAGDRWRALVRGELQSCTALSTFVREDGTTVTGQTTVTLVLDSRGRPDVVQVVGPETLLPGDGPTTAPADDSDLPLRHNTLGVIEAGRLRLSANALAVLEGVAEGCSSAQLARRLGISAKGVDYRVTRLAELLGTANRAGLVARAYAAGLLVTGVWPPRAAAHAAQWG